MIKGLESIFAEGRLPGIIHGDQGLEFMAYSVQQFLEKLKIRWTVATQQPNKAVLAEAANKMIRRAITAQLSLPHKVTPFRPRLAKIILNLNSRKLRRLNNKTPLEM